MDSRRQVRLVLLATVLASLVGVAFAAERAAVPAKPALTLPGRAKPALTLKERSGGKAGDEQRVNDCKVPYEKRGDHHRSADCPGK